VRFELTDLMNVTLWKMFLHRTAVFHSQFWVSDI